MTIPTVTALPTAPTRADSATFDTRADAFMPALVTLATEINATVAATNTATAQVTADAADTAADVVTCAGHVSDAEEQVGLAAAQVTLATAQADRAEENADRSEEAVPAWVITTAYDYPDAVAGSDGYTYRAVAATTGDNPTTDNGSHWVRTNGVPKITAGDAGKAIVVNPGATAYALMAVGASIVRSARTSNTAIAAADKGKLIDITSGTFTQTFVAAATLGDGWFCYLRNSGTGDITLDPDGAETIDGLATYVMYPGETRIVQCTGTAFYSVITSSFAKDFLSSGTFVMPPGYRKMGLKIFGGGAGGNGGGGYSAGTHRLGGAGGGGGGQNFATIAALAAGTSVTCTVGAGGTGGLGGINVVGGFAALGGITTFGTALTATGGGARNGSNPQTTGGGGGIFARDAARPFDGCGPNYLLDNAADSYSGAGSIRCNFGMGGANSSGTEATTPGTDPATFGCSEYGGSSGGNAATGEAGHKGAKSIYGATGGGGGGSVNNVNAAFAGGDGGGVGYNLYSGSAFITGSGLGGGAAGGNGAAGTPGAVFALGAGGGGGGGGGNAAGTGHAGGAGAQPGGGGGGGGGGLTTGGAGGNGGDGAVYVWGIM